MAFYFISIFQQFSAQGFYLFPILLPIPLAEKWGVSERLCGAYLPTGVKPQNVELFILGILGLLNW